MDWKKFICFFVINLFLHQNAAVQMNGNAYENLVIALHDDLAIKMDDTEAAALVQGIESVVADFSQVLWEASEKIVYVKSVKILLPRNWATKLPSITTKAPTVTESYPTADIRVEQFLLDGGVVSVEPVTLNSKPCGFSGEYIRLAPDFFTDKNGAFTSKYGNRVKNLLHHWARYRYGVFEEYGYNENVFPYFYVNTQGFKQLTGCNDTEITGYLATSNGNQCEFDPTNPGYCLFKPNSTENNQGPSTSIMHMHFLNSVSKFCDSTTHDHFAPNKQNVYCRNRSVRTILRNHEDLRNKNPVPSPTRPTFTYHYPAKQPVYVVVDTTSHGSETSQALEAAKPAIRAGLSTLKQKSVFVGVASMGGPQNAAAAVGRVGRYLIEKVPTNVYDPNAESIDRAINNLQLNGNVLLVDRALMDVGDVLRTSTYISGSLVVVVKLGPTSATSAVFSEPQVVQFLISRNIRLVTVEYATAAANANLERLTAATNGVYYKAASTTELSSKIAEAFTNVAGLIDNAYVSRTVPVALDRLNVVLGNSVVGYLPVDFRGTVGTDINFHIPEGQSCYLKVRTNTNATIYDTNSPATVYSKTNTWWNAGTYRIHNFKIPSDKQYSGFWHYEINCNPAGQTVQTIQAFAELLYVLPDSQKPSIGGGGEANRLLQVETFTAGTNGVLSLDGNLFLIYAVVTKGRYIVRGVNAIAHVEDPDGTVTSVTLYDNRDSSEYDLTTDDGVYSGYYKPPQLNNGYYHISFDLGGGRPRSFATFEAEERSLPLDQDGYCCGSSGSSDAVSAASNPFKRSLPYATTVRLTSAQSFKNMPQRIMDLKVEVASDGTTATLTWTAPKNETGATFKGKASSYVIAYNYYPNLLINDRGTVSSQAKNVSAADIVSGSLQPSEPGTVETVTITLRREVPNSRVLFTVVAQNNEGVVSYPAPMAYVTGVEPPPITTTTQQQLPSTTTTLSATTTTTPRTTNTATTPTTTRTTNTATTPITTRPTTTTTTTVPPTTPGGASAVHASFMVFLSILFTSKLLL